MPIELGYDTIAILDMTENTSNIIETVKSSGERDGDTIVNVPVVPVPQVVSSVPSETIDASYKYMAFTHSGGSENQTEYSLLFNTETECDILIVAGGGGGGKSGVSGDGGGGGAGGLIYLQNQTISSGSYTIKVGKGGDIQTILNDAGYSGYNSSFKDNIAIGGGGGGGQPDNDTRNGGNGYDGGSGGGGGTHSGGNGGKTGGTGTSSQGNDGGIGSSSNANSAGGGGSGSVGENGTSTSGGGGGTGTLINITGAYIAYAGGGGGGSEASNNPGSGMAGGGNGGGTDSDGSNALDNTGSGGGGSGGDGHGGAGGSGIVIIRYKVTDATMEPQPITYYTDVRIYPPVREITSASHNVLGQGYGNGLYEITESTSAGSDYAGFTLFNLTYDLFSGSASQYTSGVYSQNNHIVSDYKGDWVKIKLPYAINLTRYAFKQSKVSGDSIYAPGKYKIYGSTDGTNWDVIVHKDEKISYSNKYNNVVYDISDDYFEEDISVTTQYQYFALVVNELLGTGNTLKFDEWFIYGKEYISETNEYQILSFPFDHNTFEYLESDSTNLVTWYKFDDPNNIGLDSSGNNKTGVNFGSSINTSDYKIGSGSLQLSNTYFQIPNLQFTSETTISFWFRWDLTQVPSGGYNKIFDFYDSITGFRWCWQRYITQQYTYWFMGNGSSSTGNKVMSGHVLTNNQWYFFTLCVDIATGNLKIYKDATKIRDSNHPGFFSTNAVYDQALIGAHYTGNSGYMYGNVDDFRIYDKVLSESEIQDLYNRKMFTKYELTFDNPTECDILIVGGGGGGGGGSVSGSDGNGGGGGAGGLVFLPNFNLSSTYTIKVGKGGLGTTDLGINGTDSSIAKSDGTSVDGVDNFTGTGGGGGGDGRTSSQVSGPGNAGGSGGGGGGNSVTSGGVSTQNTYSGKGFGNIGGDSSSDYGDQPGGGGGAGGPGQSSVASSEPNEGGEGGIGLHKVTIDGVEYKFKDLFGTLNGEHILSASTIRDFGIAQDYHDKYYEPSTDTAQNPIPHVEEGVYFAGGGAGKASEDNYTYGGLGGGASAYIFSEIGFRKGIDGTGGGGTSGGKQANGTGRGQDSGTDGGSGIVIIRYKSQYNQVPFDAQWTYSATDTSVHHYGNVGIHTTASDTASLITKGDINITGTYFKNEQIVCDNPWYEMDSKDIYTMKNKVGIGVSEPQYTLHINGAAYANNGGVSGNGSTNWSTPSDRRIKENIVEASNEMCFENIKNINLYKFNYAKKFTKTRTKTQFGFVAQEVQKYYPKAVQEKEIQVKDGLTINNLLTVDVTQLNYTLYGAIKHYVNELDKIKSQLGIVDAVEEEPVADEIIEEEPVTEDTEEPVTNIDLV